MKTVSMSGSLRENVGKKDAKKSRRQGRVPCVLYGGKEEVRFTLEDKDFIRILFTPEVYLIKLNIDGKEYDTILQEIQYHPVTDRVLHADFLEIIPGKPLVVSVPVKVEGTASGVLKGGKLFKKMRKLRVRGLVGDIPEYIHVRIDELEIGDSIKVSDVKVDDIQLLDTPSAVIVAVKTARGAAEIEAEEAAAAAAAAAATGAAPGAAPAPAAGEKGEKKEASGKE
jgi:large subunit ribosomal protein L25